MHRKARIAIALTFSSLVLVGCGQGAGVKTDFSDRQIFEGAMFGAGPVANLLPEARDHLSPELYARSPDELNAMADARAAIIDAIERAHPGFLAAFARAARSGDPAQTHLMLMLAADAISRASATDATSDRSNNLPIASMGNNLPTTSTSNNLPIASMGNNLPTTSTSNNLPTASKSNNLPTTSTSNNLPTASISNNLPTASKSNNLPTTSTSNNLPVAGFFSSRLFTEQLANSIAVTFGPASGER